MWYDVLGLDSEYGYDPLWAKCVELGIAPTFHSASSNQGLRLSPTNFTYNHTGHFAAAVIRRKTAAPQADRAAVRGYSAAARAVAVS